MDWELDDEKSPQQLAREFERDLTGYGETLEALGARLRARPEKVTQDELYTVLGDYPRISQWLDGYRAALTEAWKGDPAPAAVSDLLADPA